MILALSVALAGPAVPPPHRLVDWGDPIPVDEAGTRAAMIVEARDERPLTVEVSAGGTWTSARTTWQSGRVSVLVADLVEPTRSVRLRSPDAARITALDIDLFAPSAAEPRSSGAAPPPSPGILPTELVAIGVISREEWGADATQCTSTEDDWYRMAIHHTAGSQTYGGTVQGAVQALQAYAVGTGEYCDIPYQFLVGHDGSLWEGRPYDYYSGATGGGNNDGNVAVCFLGCYHPSDCPESHPVTEAMMTSGQVLVQALVALDGIPSDEDSIRGHRDWPDNATACPGDWLYDRLAELREPLGAAHAATVSSLSCTPTDDGAFVLPVGATGRCDLDLLNTGLASWTPGVTNLAPIPRDEPSHLAAQTWLDPTRVTTVEAATAPGGTGRFSFDVFAPSAGEHILALGLVEEWVAWFADDGGPADGTIRVVLQVVEAEAAPVDDTGSTDPPDVPGRLASMSEIGGCAAGGAGSPPGACLVALLAIFLRARHRGPSPQG